MVYVTQYNKRYILSTFEKIEIFVLSNRRFNKHSNDTKFIKIGRDSFENTSFTKCEFPFILFVFYTLFLFAHYLRINLADIMSLLLSWVTFYISKVQTDQKCKKIIEDIAILWNCHVDYIQMSNNMACSTKQEYFHDWLMIHKIPNASLFIYF